MVGFLEGFTSLITKNISDIVLMNGCIHRYILASKILEDERKNILLSAIKIFQLFLKIQYIRKCLQSVEKLGQASRKSASYRNLLA